MIEKITMLFFLFEILFGLFVFMGDVKELKDLPKKTQVTINTMFVAAAFLGICAIKQLYLFLIILLTIEYMATLFWYKEEKGRSWSSALKGIFGILTAVIVELGIGAVYYAELEKQGAVIKSYRNKMVLSCLLAIAIVQMFTIIFWEMIKTKNVYRKSMMLLLLVKTLEEIHWFLNDFLFPISDSKYQIKSLIFIPALVSTYLLFFFFVFRVQENEVRKKREDIHVNAYEYYLNMEEEHRRIRKMYHDMKNQLMILEGDKDVFKKEYSREVLKKLETMNQFYHTGLPFLDSLLFNAKRKAEERGIAFDVVISEGCLSFMKEDDVNVIFSNAILNAIEACEKIQEKPKRIQIKAGKNLEDTLLYFKNTVAEERKKGSFTTNKQNKKMHGIGLTSIQEVVEKYNGYVSIVEENGSFQLAILFGGQSEK